MNALVTLLRASFPGGIELMLSGLFATCMGQAHCISRAAVRALCFGTSGRSVQERAADVYQFPPGIRERAGLWHAALNDSTARR